MAFLSKVSTAIPIAVKWRSGANLPGGVGGGGVGIPGLSLPSLPSLDPCQLLSGDARRICELAKTALTTPRADQPIPSTTAAPSARSARWARYRSYRSSAPPTFQPSSIPESSGCPGIFQIRVGDQCVDLTALPPGGDPALTPLGTGTAVEGGFGIPALLPAAVVRKSLQCRRGFVLGIDDLCYPKALLSRRSKFRKHRMPPRPTISRRDERAIRVASRAKDRVLALAKDAGLFASKTRPSPKKAKEVVIHHDDHHHH